MASASTKREERTVRCDSPTYTLDVDNAQYKYNLGTVTLPVLPGPAFTSFYQDESPQGTKVATFYQNTRDSFSQ